MMESINTDQVDDLSDLQQYQFARDGFLVVRGMATDEVLRRMIEVVDASLHPPLGPLEYEVDANYPGAPAGLEAPGGHTPRRLLNAYTRDAVFREWAASRHITTKVKQLIGTDQLDLTQNHHNCIMTKMPEYSTRTGWHQDIRYWSFDRPELVNVWLALGDENEARGGMQFIPGSHRLELDRGRFDAELFLREDLDENQALIREATKADLTPGDVIFFHCRTFHLAGVNRTAQPKYSVVFSYHAHDNLPIPGTRSARLESIDVS